MPSAVIDALKTGHVKKCKQAEINAVFAFLSKYTRQSYSNDFVMKLLTTPTATASEAKALDRLQNEEGYRVRDANGAVLYESASHRARW